MGTGRGALEKKYEECLKTGEKTLNENQSEGDPRKSRHFLKRGTLTRAKN